MRLCSREMVLSVGNGSYPSLYSCSSQECLRIGLMQENDYVCESPCESISCRKMRKKVKKMRKCDSLSVIDVLRYSVFLCVSFVLFELYFISQVMLCEE